MNTFVDRLGKLVPGAYKSIDGIVIQDRWTAADTSFHFEQRQHDALDVAPAHE